MRLWFWLLVLGSLTHLSATAYMRTLFSLQIDNRIMRFCSFILVIQTGNLLESVLFMLYSNVEAQCSYTAKLGIKIFLSNRFYGKNSSYVHGGLDSNGKPADAVYGQSVRTFKKKAVLSFYFVTFMVEKRNLSSCDSLPHCSRGSCKRKKKNGEGKNPLDCRQQ